MSERICLEKNPDKQLCIRCGSPELATGWECDDCGYDNVLWYCPEYRLLNKEHSCITTTGIEAMGDE